MKVAVCGEQRSHVGQDFQYIMRVQVVEETVRQDEIELLAGSGAIVADIRNNEISLVPAAGTLDVTLVEIDT
jgi:hypothetical protein